MDSCRRREKSRQPQASGEGEARERSVERPSAEQKLSGLREGGFPSHPPNLQLIRKAFFLFFFFPSSLLVRVAVQVQHTHTQPHHCWLPGAFPPSALKGMAGIKPAHLCNRRAGKAEGAGKAQDGGVRYNNKLGHPSCFQRLLCKQTEGRPVWPLSPAARLECLASLPCRGWEESYLKAPAPCSVWSGSSGTYPTGLRDQPGGRHGQGQWCPRGEDISLPHWGLPARIRAKGSWDPVSDSGQCQLLQRKGQIKPTKGQ